MISLWTYRLYREPVHSLDQNGRSFSRFQTETAQKPYLLGLHIPICWYMTYVREYPPECPQSNRVSFPGGDSNIKVAGGARRKFKLLNPPWSPMWVWLIKLTSKGNASLCFIQPRKKCSSKILFRELHFYWLTFSMCISSWRSWKETECRKAGRIPPSSCNTVNLRSGCIFISLCLRRNETRDYVRTRASHYGSW